MEQVDACACASGHGHGQDADLVGTRGSSMSWDVVYHLGCGFSSGAGILDLDWSWYWDWVHIACWDSIRTLFFPTRWIYHLKPDFDFSGGLPSKPGYI
jgi:hypothetical protein